MDSRLQAFKQKRNKDTITHASSNWSSYSTVEEIGKNSKE
jgi:hypothetical protein